MTGTWIRAPAWDAVWILSGIPLALTLGATRFGAPATIGLICVVLFREGHLLAPVGLALGHAGFRRYLLTKPGKFIALPLGLLTMTTAIGCVVEAPELRVDLTNFANIGLADYRNPLVVVLAIYGLWNAYHFGKQNFGVLRLYRREPGGRRKDLVFACGMLWAAVAVPLIPHAAEAVHDLTGWPAAPQPFLDVVRYGLCAAGLAAAAAMLWRERRLPRIALIAAQALALVAAFWVGLWVFALISLNHWLTAIGLAAHVDGNAHRRSPAWFAGGAMIAGVILFCLLFVDPRSLALRFTSVAVGLRIGLGFVHFLYDRWLYKFSRPEVRETIGRDLFVVRQASMLRNSLIQYGRKT